MATLVACLRLRAAPLHLCHIKIHRYTKLGVSTDIVASVLAQMCFHK